MILHLNRISCEIPKEIVPMLIIEPTSGCRLNLVNFANFYSVIVYLSSVNKPELVVTCILTLISYDEH